MPGSRMRASNEKALSLIPNKYKLAQTLKVIFKKHLVYYLYRLPLERRYKNFEVPKKTGGQRTISAPNSGLKVVQRRLVDLLADVYTPRNGVHAFVKGRSILTNAEQHVGRRYVLNIDLSNFFDSINFGRVRGIFKARPYLATNEVATVLAQICCHRGKLPQGAPTSPVISNMICASLDSGLREFARKNKCTYTRYCDDITFSTNLSRFPEQVALREGEGEVRIIALGSQLIEIIHQNGFEINHKKTRLLTRSDRQEVTGLVVNEFPNVPRKYLRNLRAALHAWERYGLEAFQEVYAVKYYAGDSEGKVPDVQRVIQSRIQYVGSIRGFGDNLYATLRDRFNALSDLKDSDKSRDLGISPRKRDLGNRRRR